MAQNPLLKMVMLGPVLCLCLACETANADVTVIEKDVFQTESGSGESYPESPEANDLQFDFSRVFVLRHSLNFGRSPTPMKELRTELQAVYSNAKYVTRVKQKPLVAAGKSSQIWSAQWRRAPLKLAE